MANDEFWKKIQSPDPEIAGVSHKTGALNIALLFGTAVIAMTLILTPFLAKQADDADTVADLPAFDNLTTGSVKSTTEHNGRRFTIRRSILQDDPSLPCRIEGTGPQDPCE
jgi:hypothetical protein